MTLHSGHSDNIAVVHHGFGRDIYSVPPSNIPIIRKVGTKLVLALVQVYTNGFSISILE
jgi:hypothetical protein